MALVLIGALCFVALGAWLAFSPEQFAESRRGGLAKYAGWASIIFFGFCALIAAKQLLNSSVQIRVGDSGVYAAKVSAQTIPWADIRAVEGLEMTVASNKQKFAVLRLREDSHVEFTRSHKLSQRANAGFGLEGAFISLNGHVHNPDESMSAIDLGFRSNGAKP